jgi:hypothetical protein
LLERLGALSIDTSEATIVRVELRQPPRAAGPLPLPQPKPLSPFIRYPVTGALSSSSAALLIGTLLYEAALWRISFAAGLFGHVFISVLAGAALGAVIGILVAAVKKISQPLPPAQFLQHLASEGFLVVIKTPPHLAEQAEAIARRLGAKEIIL